MSDTYPPVKPTLRRIALLCLLAVVTLVLKSLLELAQPGRKAAH